jgi:hypothetical protein
MAEPGEPTLSEEEAQKQVWPQILELQKLLVERVRRVPVTNGGALDAISITSCEHHSCH